jgi:hypothetical protein
MKNGRFVPIICILYIVALTKATLSSRKVLAEWPHTKNSGSVCETAIVKGILFIPSYIRRPRAYDCDASESTFDVAIQDASTISWPLQAPLTSQSLQIDASVTNWCYARSGVLKPVSQRRLSQEYNGVGMKCKKPEDYDVTKDSRASNVKTAAAMHEAMGCSIDSLAKGASKNIVAADNLQDQLEKNLDGAKGLGDAAASLLSDIDELQNIISVQNNIVNQEFLKMSTKIVANMNSYFSAQSALVLFYTDTLPEMIRAEEYGMSREFFINRQQQLVNLENSGQARRLKQLRSLRMLNVQDDECNAHLLVPDMYLHYNNASHTTFNYYSGTAEWLNSNVYPKGSICQSDQNIRWSDLVYEVYNNATSTGAQRPRLEEYIISDQETTCFSVEYTRHPLISLAYENITVLTTHDVQEINRLLTNHRSMTRSVTEMTTTALRNSNPDVKRYRTYVGNPFEGPTNTQIFKPKHTFSSIDGLRKMQEFAKNVHEKLRDLAVKFHNMYTSANQNLQLLINILRCPHLTTAVEPSIEWFFTQIHLTIIQDALSGILGVLEPNSATVGSTGMVTRMPTTIKIFKTENGVVRGSTKQPFEEIISQQRLRWDTAKEIYPYDYTLHGAWTLDLNISESSSFNIMADIQYDTFVDVRQQIQNNELNPPMLPSAVRTWYQNNWPIPFACLGPIVPVLQAWSKEGVHYDYANPDSNQPLAKVRARTEGATKPPPPAEAANVQITIFPFSRQIRQFILGTYVGGWLPLLFVNPTVVQPNTDNDQILHLNADELIVNTEEGTNNFVSIRSQSSSGTTVNIVAASLLVRCFDTSLRCGMFDMRMETASYEKPNSISLELLRVDTGGGSRWSAENPMSLTVEIETIDSLDIDTYQVSEALRETTTTLANYKKRLITSIEDANRIKEQVIKDALNKDRVDSARTALDEANKHLQDSKDYARVGLKVAEDLLTGPGRTNENKKLYVQPICYYPANPLITTKKDGDNIDILKGVKIVTDTIASIGDYVPTWFAAVQCITINTFQIITLIVVLVFCFYETLNLVLLYTSDPKGYNRRAAFYFRGHIFEILFVSIIVGFVFLVYFKIVFL